MVDVVEAPIARFKTYPAKKTRPHWYFMVSVWDTNAAMDRYTSRVYKMRTNTCHAVCLVQQYGRRRQLGEIVFSADSVKNPEYVAHECTHAALVWWKKVFGSDEGAIDLELDAQAEASKPEEMFASALGTMVGQIHKYVSNLHP